MLFFFIVFCRFFANLFYVLNDNNNNNNSKYQTCKDHFPQGLPLLSCHIIIHAHVAFLSSLFSTFLRVTVQVISFCSLEVMVISDKIHENTFSCSCCWHLHFNYLNSSGFYFEAIIISNLYNLSNGMFSNCKLFSNNTSIFSVVNDTHWRVQLL